MIVDPQFLADVRQSKLEIRPKSGEQVQTTVNAVAQFPPEVLAQTAAIVKW